MLSIFKTAGMVVKTVGKLAEEIASHGGGTDANGWHAVGGRKSGNPPHWHPKPGQKYPGKPYRK